MEDKDWADPDPEPTPAERGLTCTDCDHYNAAPNEWVCVQFGWCHKIDEWVRASDEACDFDFVEVV